MAIDELDRLEVIIKPDEGEVEPFIGTVSGESSFIEIDLTLTAGSYSKNDVLADTQIIENVLRANGATGIWQSCTLLDKGHNGGDIDIFILKKNTSIGTENSPINISDSDAEDILGVWTFESQKYVDLVNSKFIQQDNIGVMVKSEENSSDLYVAAVDRDGDTHVENGIHLKLGFLLD